MNMEFEKKLALPGEVQEDNPLTAEMEQNIAVTSLADRWDD